MLLAWAVAAAPAIAAELRGAVKLNRLTAEDGLANDIVSSIVQDATGFMWFGTQEGLDRYDGARFDHFRHDPRDPSSLASDDISSVSVDSSGTLWVATWGGGLDRFDSVTETFTHYRGDPDEPTRLRDSRVQLTFEDSTGVLWIGTFSGGLSRLDPSTGQIRSFFNDPDDSSSLSDNRVWALAEDADGAIWVGTNNGLNRLDRGGERFTRFSHDPHDPGSLPSSTIRALNVDREWTLWVATEEGLRFFDRKSESFRPLPGASSEVRLLSTTPSSVLLNDHGGVLWVGTYGAGLCSVDLASGRITRLVHDPADVWSLSDDDVRALYEDHSGVLWIATRGGGLNRLDLKPQKFEHVRSDPLDPTSLSHDRVWSILEDHEGTVWVGTMRGLDRWDTELGGFRHYRHDPANPRSISADHVQSLIEDRDGTMWVATGNAGLCRFERASESFDSYRADPRDPSSLSDDRVTSLFTDRDNALWVGTVDGLNRLDPERRAFTRYSRTPGDPAGLADAYILSIFQDRRGRLWIGTDSGGLDSLDLASGEVRHHRPQAGDEEGLSSPRVRAITEDSQGRLWIATGNGLNVRDPDSGRFTRYSEHDGLPSSNIYGILEDGEGRFWLSTNRGLSRFDPRTLTFRNYTVSDGLQGNNFSYGAFCKGRDGRMYFGGLRGLNVFHPERVHDNPNVPRVVLRYLRVIDEPVPSGPPIADMQRFVLDYRASSFTIGFAALDFTDPGSNRYQHLLEGYDKGWVDAGARPAASYVNVAPGTYTFRVRGSNNDGVWNEAGAALIVTVTPPFWQTWWFRLTGAALVTAAVAGWYRRRMRRVESERSRLEVLVSERTRELEQRRDQLEKINAIVASINSEHAFAALLGSLLDRMRIIEGTERAAALVLDHETDTFKSWATSGWPESELVGMEMTAEEAERTYLSQAEQIYEDIFVTKRAGDRCRPAGPGALPAPLSSLVMRIVVEERVDGYLILSSMSDPNAFDERDVLLLRSLKEHILSAFIKTRMLQELKTLNAKKDEFLGIAAHDLRNPLGLISSWARVVMRHIEGGKFTPERALRDLGRVVTVAEQMNRLVTELLDISAIESGKLSVTLHRTRMRSIIEQCEQLHSAVASEKGIELVIEPDGELPEVLVDHDRIIEVMNNLLSNAIKFTRPGGRVRVYCEHRAPSVITHVEDTGQGLTEDDLKVVFRTFGRLSAQPTGGEPSTGLGLAIVKKIVELHDGHIWVSSEKGKGSTFSFSLPVADAVIGLNKDA